MGTHLQTPFAQKLVSRSKGDLNNSPQLCHLPRDIVLDVSDTLEVRDELFDDDFPSDEAFYEDVGWAEVLWSDVLADEGLGAGDRGAAFAGCT